MKNQRLMNIGMRCVILFFTVSICTAAAENRLPQFEELYKLLRENAVGLTDEELNQAAVRGLLSELESRVSIVTNAPGSEPASSTNLLGKTEIYDRHFAYFRIGQVEEGLSERLAEQLQQIEKTNTLKGIVLDLRYAGGSDFAAAAKTADPFLNSEQPLLEWGTRSVTSRQKTNAITFPVAVLVNHQTRGAAEALAAILRETKVGLLLGSRTAGEASVYKEFPLENGERLRIATAQVKVGGSEISEPIKPDIEVSVNPEDERTFFEDPYRQISQPIADVELSLNPESIGAAETNRPRRLNEAELVRRKREGLSEETESIDRPSLTAESEIKVIRDPALARAIDLLKGLSVIRSARPR